MTDFDVDAIADAIVGSDALKAAASSVLNLVSLWPLDDATRIDNDVKYGEELQVRLTREMAARKLPDGDVTIADAEYVYEGAVEEIPGRPEQISAVLLAANDAYDDVAGYSEDLDVNRITSVGDTLGLDWSVEKMAQLKSIVEASTAKARNKNSESQSGTEAQVNEESIKAHMALVAAAYMGILALGEEFSSVALLYANELNEIEEVPRVFVGTSDTDALRALAVKAVGGDTTALAEFAQKYAELASTECSKHHEDVLWDPAQAKKAAKEADEAKNKAALAAKFAHVNNDEGKEHVEL